MKMISREELKRLRETYPAGTRVELVRMDDEQAPPPGTAAPVPERIPAQRLPARTQR